MFIFGNSITRRVEAQQKINGQIAVLKKQQKVESERVIKEFAVRKEDLINDINAQISRCKAEIISLNNQREAQCELLDEQQKVTLDKVINDFDRKIVNKTNKAKRLGYLVDAEQKNMQDVINPDAPNAPVEVKHPVGFGSEEKTILLEKETPVKKTTKKSSK